MSCDENEGWTIERGGRVTWEKTVAANWVYGVDLVDVLPAGAELDPTELTVVSAGVTTSGDPFVDGTGVYVRVLGGDPEVDNFVTFRFGVLGTPDLDERTIYFRIVAR